MNAVELEQAFHDAIQNYLDTDEKKKEALKYFEGCTINEMIEEVCEE